MYPIPGVGPWGAGGLAPSIYQRFFSFYNMDCLGKLSPVGGNYLDRDFNFFIWNEMMLLEIILCIISLRL